MDELLKSIRVVNSTNTFNFGRELSRAEFLSVAQKGINTVYYPQKFHAIIARIRIDGDATETVTALIFRSGKLVLTGARSWASAEAASRKICRQINSCLSKNPIGIFDLKLRNVVATGTFPLRLAIEKFYSEWRVEKSKFGNITVRYDPTIFTGLRVVAHTEFTAIFFIGGKFIVTGLKSFEGISDKIINLCNILMNFKR